MGGGRSDVFIRIYENIESYPEELALSPSQLLNATMWADDIEYVRNVFNSAQKPPECVDLKDLEAAGLTRWDHNGNACPNESPWCDAGQNLIGNTGGPTFEEWEAR